MTATITFDEALQQAFTEIDRAFERGDRFPVSAYIGSLKIEHDALRQHGYDRDADVVAHVIEYLELCGHC